jgi:hypothetical protein
MDFLIVIPLLGIVLCGIGVWSAYKPLREEGFLSTRFDGVATAVVGVTLYAISVMIAPSLPSGEPAQAPPSQAGAEDEYASPAGFKPVELGLILNEHKDSRHTILDVWTLEDSTRLFVINKRTGISGVSYAKRLVDCKTRSFAYYGEGETVAEMEAGKPSAMSKAVRGSISDIISSRACQIAGAAWGW